MSEDSQVILTTEEDIKRLEDLLVGNSTRSLRIAFNRVKRRMVIYESRLVELYRNEKIIKARIYNNADALKIDTDYTAGKNKRNIPVQTFEGITIADDPHQNISYDKFNIMTLEEGVRKLDSELNRINTEIKHLQAAKDLYQKKYNDIKERLEKAAKDKESRSQIGRAIAPTQEDLDADQIAQARTANILLLQEISSAFKDLTRFNTTQASPGTSYKEYLESLEKTSGYPDGDRTVVNQLRVYQQLFWAHGHSKGLTAKNDAGEVVPISTLLNFDNPGDTKNIEVLKIDVSKNRLASKNSKISLSVERYIRDVNSVIADPLVSKGVEIRPDISIPLTESMRADTINYPSSVLRIGDFYLGSFELPTLSDTIRKNWKKRNARLYFGLPVCPNAKPTGTSTDIKEEESQEVTDAQTLAAQIEYLKRLEDAENFVVEEVQTTLGDLPKNAPEWVKTYVLKYERANLGTLNYLGDEVTVLRGTSEESTQLAYERANKMKAFPPKTMEEKVRYDYASLLGIRAEVDGDILFVSKENLDLIEEGEIPPQIGSQKTAQIKADIEAGGVITSYEYIAYIMWGSKGAFITG